MNQGRLLDHPGLARIARTRDATPSQVALAWVLRQAGVVAIPKATQPDHVRQNRAALDIDLTREDLIELDREFPAPRRKVPLEML
jgi:diketogulonate reductase-like aldo/keto reductase